MTKWRLIIIKKKMKQSKACSNKRGDKCPPLSRLLYRVHRFLYFFLSTLSPPIRSGFIDISAASKYPRMGEGMGVAGVRGNFVNFMERIRG